MATRTLGIKFEVVGFKKAADSIKQLNLGIKESVKANKEAVKENLAIAKSEEKRAEAIDKANKRILFSYLGLRKQAKTQTEGILADTKRAINRSRNQIASLAKDYFKYNFGSNVQRQQVIVKQEKQDFRQRETYRALSKQERNQVLEQRLIFREFSLEIKKLINEDLKTVIEETVRETNSSSGFEKFTSIIKAPFDLAGKAIVSPIEAVLFGGLQRIGEELTKDFAQGVSSQMQKNLGLQFKEVGQDLGGAIGSSMYLAYEKIMIATRNSVIDRHSVSGSNETLHLQKLLDDFGQILQGFFISLGAIPIKAKKRIDLDKKAIPLVKEKAGELMINKKLNQAQEAEIAQSKSITVLTGGANYDEQAGTTDFAYRTLQPMLRGSYVHPVKNLFSNAQGTAEFDRVFGEMLSMGLANDTAKAELLQFAKNNMDEDVEGALTDEELEQLFTGDAAEVSEKITDFFKKIHIPLPKILEVVFKGYNPDDIAMAAEGIFFKEKYPDLPLQFMGTSFGGFNAAGAAELMNRMGYEDVKAVGVTTPLVGMESTVDPENYFSSIGDLDFLYEMTLGSIFKGKVPKPDNLQVVPGRGKGHILGMFLANSPEFRNYLQHFLKGRVDVPSMQEYNKQEVLLAGMLPGNNAESAIVRTIKKNLGEKYDDGYTFNQEDLIGHRDYLVRRAGGANLRKIKNPQLKEFYQDYVAFLDTLAEELETIEKFKQVGKKFKPVNSLRKAVNFYPDLGHFLPNHPDFEMTKAEYAATNQEVEANKNIIAFKRKIDNESANIERTYRAMLGEDISEQGYGYYDEEEYQVRANEHLAGLIGYLENDVLQDANNSEIQAAQPYLELLKKLQQTILQVGETGELNTDEIAEAEKLLGISLKDYKSVLSGDEILNVKQRKSEIQAAAKKAKMGKQSSLVMDVKPELEAYIWAINQELIREGKEQIDIATAEYLGSGYKNHAIKANNKVYKFARHTNPLAAKVNKMMGKKKESYKAEIAALKKLQGENAPNFIAGGEEFMAMEEAEGITLKEALLTASPEERRELLKKSAQLLKSFHQKGVAHFDFHPGNIIKQKDGNLVAIDWESAQLTKDKKQHYFDREVAVSRFQDILHGSMKVESSEDVAMMFDDAYYGNQDRVEIRDSARATQQQIVARYNQQLNQIIERSAEAARSAIESNEVGINLDTAYSVIRDRMKEYRRAVEQGLFEQARRTGELILKSSEYLKQVFNETGDNRRGQLTRIQNEIIQGDRGAGRSSVPLANLFAQTDAVQLELDFQEIGEQVQAGFDLGADGREAGRQFAEDVKEEVQDEFDINSPSDWAEWIGQMVRKGFELGIRGLTGLVDEELSGLDEIANVEGINEGLDDFLSEGIDNIGNFFDELEDRFPIVSRIKNVLGDVAAVIFQIVGIASIGEFMGDLVRVSLDVAMGFESMERSMVAASGGFVEGAKNINFIRGEVNRLSIDLRTAQQAYSSLLTAARNTQLEGETTKQIFSAFAESASNRGLNAESQDRLFRALSQIVAKRELRAEEVVGQIGDIEGFGDFKSLIEGALGVNSSQLDDMMSRGEVGLDVLPKIAAQLRAQNTIFASQPETAQQAKNRYDNSKINLQDNIGRTFQPAQKAFFNQMAKVFDFLSDKVGILIKLSGLLAATWIGGLIGSALKTKTAMTLLGIVLNQIIILFSTVVASSRAALIALRRFLLLAVALEVGINIFKLYRNQFPEAQKDIENLTKGIQAFTNAVNEASTAGEKLNNNLPKQGGQLKLAEGWKLPDNWFGNIIRDGIGQDYLNLDFMRRGLDMMTGGRAVTQAEKKEADFLVASSDFQTSSNKILTNNYKAAQAADKIAEFDQEILAIQSERLRLLPGDTEGLQKSLEAEKAIQTERDKQLKILTGQQQNLQLVVNGTKARLEELEGLRSAGGITQANYDREKNLLTLLLEDAEAGLQDLADILGLVPKELSAFNRELTRAKNRVSGFMENRDRISAQERTDIINQGIAEGEGERTIQLKLDEANAEDIESRIEKLSTEIAKVTQNLDSAVFTEAQKRIEEAAASSGGLTTDVINRLLEQERDPQEKEALQGALTIRELESQLFQYQEQLAQLSQQSRSNLIDLNRSIEDYFFNLIQRIKEARLETENLISQLFATNLRNQLLAAISPGSDSFVRGIIDSIGGLFDQAQSLIEQSLGIKNSELQLEAESRSLEIEMQDFIRGLNGATDALQDFRTSIRNNPSSRVGDTSTNSSESNYFPLPGLDLNKATITSGYGYRTIFGRKDFHEGIDIAATGGTDVLAVNSGVISNIKPLADQMQVAVESINASGQKVTEWFIHLAKNLNVKKGDRVYAGQKIGEVAATTDTARRAKVSTGDHLDYRVMVGGEWVNPQEFLTKAEGETAKTSALSPIPSALSQELIGTRQQNLDFQQLLIEAGAKEDFERTVADVRERNNRQFNLEGLQNSNNLADTLDKLADLREQSQLPTAEIEMNQQLRSVAANFRGLKLQGIQGLQKFADDVANLQGIIEVFPSLIQKIEDSGNSEWLAMLPVLQDALANAEAQSPKTTEQLKAAKQAYEEIAKEEEKAIAFARRQGELKVMQEKLTKRSQLSQVRLNIATQRGTSELRRQNEITAQKLQLEDRILQIRQQYGNTEYAENLIQLERQQSRINIENINRDALDRDTAYEQQLLELSSGIARGRGGLLSGLGFDLESNKIQRENAIAQENFRYQQELVRLERTYGAEPDKLALLKQRAEELNQVNLEGIQQQFKTLGGIIRQNAQQALSDFFAQWFRDISNGKELFLGFVRTILEGIARMAAQRLAASIMGSIFGGLGGAVSGGATATSLNFGSGVSAFTAKEGATVPKPISDRLAQISPNIREGFRKEGSKGVLGIFTPGEEILSIKTGEAGRYQSLKRRFGKDPLERLFKGNFANGGTIDIEQNLLSSLAVPEPSINIEAIREPNSRQPSTTQNITNFSATVVTPDADSFRASEYQQQQDIAEALLRSQS